VVLSQMIREVNTEIQMQGVNLLSNLQRPKELSGERLLLDKLLSSDTKADILAMLHNNPALSDGIDGIARRIGRTPGEIQADVKDLIDLGILSKKTVDGSEVVHCDPKRDGEIQEIITNYLKRTVVG